jgi:hypothetical protein
MAVTAEVEGASVLEQIYLPDTTNTRDYAELLELYRKDAETVSEFPVQHDLYGGVYLRTLFLHKGFSVIGCKHKVPSQLIIHGDALVTTSEGIRRVRGFAVIQTPPGCWRAVEALEDTIFTAVFSTPVESLLDLEVIQKATIENHEDIASNKMNMELSA